MKTGDTQSIVSTIRELFGLDIHHIHFLPGELDLNYYLRERSGKSYTLKLAHYGESRGALDMQNQMMLHLEKAEPPLDLPKVIPNRAGSHISEIVDENGKKRWLRLLTWVAGRLFANVSPHSSSLLQSLGGACGQMTRALVGFDHPQAHRSYKWEISQANWVSEHFGLLQDEPQVALAQYFYQLYQGEVQPWLPQLAKSVVYNDANDYNILVSDSLSQPKVKGFIDFGDALFTHTISELAIAIAYAVMGQKDPLSAAVQMVKAYHQIQPISETECRVLFPMICTRLLISVTIAAINRKEHPDNRYLFVSESRAWDLLEKFRRVAPALAHYRFREACKYLPCPLEKIFREWLTTKAPSFHPIVDVDFRKLPPKKLDLSVGSLDLGNNSNFFGIRAFKETIERLLDDQQVGMGGYGELRPFYSTDAYLIWGNEGPQWRTLHLGLDIWRAAGSRVYAPLEGSVWAIHDNAGERNYGPTIILEHRISEQLHFYTLYGHLSRASLQDLKKGERIKPGQIIAHIGEDPENGNWPPHLHFQLILDMLDNDHDFPGVAFPDQAGVWKSLCPDPNLLVMAPGLMEKRQLNKDQIAEKRKNLLGRSLSVSYEQPLAILRGFGCYLYDESGRRYLDTVNNVAHVGHEHPEVVRAAQRQMAVLNTNTRYLHEEIVRFAEELVETLPGNLSVCHFVNSGSEANELALRLAKSYTRQRDMLVMEMGYHGNTNACIEISSYKFDSRGGSGAKAHIHVLPMPDTYRGKFKAGEPGAGKKYANFLQQKVDQLRAAGKGLAGFICESILSCGGQIPLPAGYLAEAYRIVRSAGGVCIADEVQVGFGRVGNHFWAFEAQGVVPDIVVLGKPIGNGHPLGAVITTPEIAEAFNNGMEYFNTFGGNPVSSAVGRAVLRTIKKEGLQEQAKVTGQYLTDGLKSLQEHHRILGDVRGPGLFMGIELVRSRELLTPAKLEAEYLANRMRQRGILMSTDGPYHNVLKIKPPLCFGPAQADFLLDQLDQVLKEDFLRL